MRIRCSWALIVVVLFACGTAAAQDTGKAGITMAFPASMGVIWHATDKVAVRPDFSFARNTNEGSISTTTWTLGTGVSALFYMSTSDRVRTYVSPRYSYTRASASSTQGSISDTTVNGSSFSGSFGAELSASSRFGVFGEVGVTYARQTTKPGIAGTVFKGTSTGTRAGVGIIFYP
jgi:outer membrane protein W